MGLSAGCLGKYLDRYRFPRVAETSGNALATISLSRVNRADKNKHASAAENRRLNAFAGS